MLASPENPPNENVLKRLSGENNEIWVVQRQALCTGVLMMQNMVICTIEGLLKTHIEKGDATMVGHIGDTENNNIFMTRVCIRAKLLRVSRAPRLRHHIGPCLLLQIPMRTGTFVSHPTRDGE